MADVVYLHVGAPKTGTTYLQGRLFANRATLAEHDMHYPVGVHADMFAAAVDLTERSWGGLQARGEWDRLVGRVSRASGTALVSHELLAGATSAQVERAMTDLAEAELHLVYSARDIGRQLPAEWQESLKYRRRGSFQRYLRRAQHERRRDSAMWFWRAHGLPDVLSRWSRGLPPERVHLVTVPHPGAPPDQLWLRYCRAFGIDPAWAPVDAGRANPSLGIDEAALLRRLNKRLRSTGLDSASYAAIVRRVVVHETLARRDDMRRVVLPPAARAWAEEVAEEWLAWVEGSGIDVVGDAEDLRPAFPEPQRWRNPDRPRPRRVSDAALDALVAVVLETADRPDPDASTVARLGRAARRLRS